LHLPAADRDALALAAHEMHLDAAAVLVEDGAVLEAVEIEIAAKLAVDAAQEVEVEGGGDAVGVVIGGAQHVAVLHEIDADDHARAGPENAAGVTQETLGL